MPDTRLEAFAENVWTAAAPQKFHGVELGTRMTVLRLSGDRLWVHSPIALDAALVAALKNLGDVAFVVAPNRLHHLYLPQFCDRFPEARVYLAPKLGKKLQALHPDFRYEAELNGPVPVAWGAELDQQLIAGIPRFQEVVFLHRPSATLIVTDAVYNLGQGPGRTIRLLARLLRRSRPGALFDEDALRIVREDAQVRQSLQRIAGWEFRHLILAHGGCIRDLGREAFLQAYQRLLAS